MAEHIQSHNHNIHARLQWDLVEKASDTITATDLNAVGSTYLDGFCGCHYKELHSCNKKEHRQRGSQGDESNHTGGHLRCERTSGYSAIYQYKQFESGIMKSEPSIDLRRVQPPTAMNHCQPEIQYHKKSRKNKKNTEERQRNLLKATANDITRHSSITSSLATPGITPTTSSNPLDNLASKISRESYPERSSMPVKDKCIHHGLKKRHAISKISIGTLPKRYSKKNSRHRSFFCAYSKLLFLHNRRRIKPKSIKKNKANDDEIISILSPAIRKKKKRKRYSFERDLPTKIPVSKLRVNLSTHCTNIPVASDSMMQNFCDQSEQSFTQCLPFPKPISTPYAKTVAVYTVHDQRPKKRKPAVDLSTKSSFNVKFYKSMGDGRQMFGNGSPYMQMPRNYSPTNVARAGRDEDGCICVYIPQENNYGYMEPSFDTGGSFLKRYFRVLLKENKRCVKRCPPQKLYSCGNCRPNPCRGRIMMPSDYSAGCKCKRNLRGNDAACQCKHKERREPRSDDIYCRDRGTTCSAPTFPENENRSNHVGAINAINSDKRDKNAVNIGSNFSFQVGLYKRCIDTNPNQNTLSTNHSFSERNRDDGYFVNVPANDPNLRYMEGDARYNTGRGGDDCCYIASDYSACCEPKPSVLNELLSPRPGCTPPPSPCCTSKSPSTGSSFLKQFERSDLCCNNEPKSRCKPKHKAVRCRCDKKPKVIGCYESKRNVGVNSTGNLISSTASSSCKCYKVKNIGCCCTNEPILAECPKKKSCCSTCNDPASKKSGRSCPSCEQTSSCCKCKKPKKKKPKCCNCEPKNRGACGKCKLKTCKEQKKKEKCCRCDEKKGTCRKCNKPRKKVVCCSCGGQSSSLWNILCKDKESCCSCKKRKLFLVRTFSMLLQKKRRCNKCDLRKSCKCPSKGGEFDYKKMLNNLKISTKRQKKAEEKPCPCGQLNVKKVLSSLLVPPEPKHQTRAQQCKCNGGVDIKKTFGRLLLFNTVRKEVCCSKVSYDQNSRSVGIGEEDYRKLPPCRRSPDRSQGDGFALNKFVSRLIKPEGNTKMHYSAFNPLNQCEAGMQHSSRLGPGDRAGATVCRNQGSCGPKSKPMTVKDCENATCPALHGVDPNRKAVRIGSSCSFSLEFYKGMPPSKKCPPPCPTTCNPPCPAPCAETPVCNPPPCRQSQPFLQRAAKYMVSNPKQKMKPTCKKCNSCVKVPMIKRGFAKLILKDKKPIQGAKTCQKTNTLQPNRKLVTRQTTGKGLGTNVKCDPYVCLKRINQRKCCK